MKNRGSVTVEASIAVPIFLFFVLSMVRISMLLLAEAHIHQSLAEAAEYTAQYGYLEKKLAEEKGIGEEGALSMVVNEAVLIKQFHSCLGEDFYVEQSLLSGNKGIILTLHTNRDNPKRFTARADYMAIFSVPVFGKATIPISNEIEKKVYVGYSKEESNDCYVYVTPNQAVYHIRRNCTHLQLSVTEISSSQKGSYTPCSFCGKEEKGTIYVARTSHIYHGNRNCLGLKRTVGRVRLSEVIGKGACSRCGRGGS